MMKRLIVIPLALVFAGGCSKKKEKEPSPEPAKKAEAETTPETKAEDKPEAVNEGAEMVVFAPEDIEWVPVDPSQPDGMATFPVHGNPAEGASAMYFRVPAGADAGVHTHTAGYHAIVLNGNHVHWIPGEKDVKPMARGSYWYQPGGQAHGDKCEGDVECVLFVVMEGKHDYAPAPDVKTVEVGDYKLVHAADMKFAPMNPDQKGGSEMAMLSGDPKAGPLAFAIQNKKDEESGLHSHTSDYHSVVLKDGSAHWADGPEGETGPLTAGSYWFQPGGQVHGDACRGDDGCHLFIFMPKGLDFIPKAE